MSPALRADSAMRAFHAGLDPLVAAIRAKNHVALGPRKEIEDQSKERNKHHQQHPENGAVHAAGFGIACPPDKQCNLECNQSQPDDEEEAAASTTCGTACRPGAIVILSQTPVAHASAQTAATAAPRNRNRMSRTFLQIDWEGQNRRRTGNGRTRRMLPAISCASTCSVLTEQFENARGSHAPAHAHRHHAEVDFAAAHFAKQCRG